MEKICGGDKPYVAPELLEAKHQEQNSRALEHFRRIKKMGGREFSQRYEDELMQELSDLFADLAKHNQSKNIFNTFRTPAILFGIIVVLYVTSGVTDHIGLSLIAQLCNLIVGLLLLSLLAWGYIRYSGEYRELGIVIDNTAEFVMQKIRAIRSPVHAAPSREQPPSPPPQKKSQ
ncbi:PREDICTED: atlastin-3-like [Thamnophis sirtalis]|uniref:Atlastin-3-like n=1 Tax=Thamnophis sirtalis TaxID=35019 RepID=A0A6I9YIR8_9SAUR|nr:PREDICTED: atlastin-3-like [Thamnophis sirtalis]